MKTKKVRILKDGCDNGINYCTGEIYDLHCLDRCHAKIKYNGEYFLVSLEKNNTYGLEAEIIEEDVIEQSKELTINLW